MHRVEIRIFCLLAAWLAGAYASAAGAPQANVRAQLISEARTVAPGAPFWVALQFDIKPGWHTYWRNPGDSGKATTLAWTLPAGFSAGPIQWTTPHRFELPPLVNFGYAEHVIHLVRIDAPQDLRPAPAWHCGPMPTG